MSVCPRCERPAPEGARFCPACGSRLAAAEGGRFASPGAYTPPHLARRILDARAAVEGERKQVTVLFADIHGLVDVMGDRDPEEVGPIVDRVRELMMEAVHRYEGTVNQVVGDGIMALFGAPLAHEDHAVRACYAALRMQAQVSAYGDEVQRSLGLPLLIRVGLNSGEVVARSIGHDLAPVVDDLSPGDGRGGPAAGHVPLVGAEIHRRVQHGEVHLHLAVDVDDHQIGIGADLDRALPGVEPEEPRRPV